MKYLLIVLLSVILLVKNSRADEACGPHNPMTHVCCDGNLIASAGITPSCCGTKMYDAAFSICCNGSIHSKSGNKICTKFFSFEIDSTCNKKIKRK